MDFFRAENFRKNLHSFFIIRFFFLIALFFAFFLLPFINERIELFSFRNKLILILVFFFTLVNFLSIVLGRVLNERRLRLFAYLQFFVEIFFWVLIAYLTGGIESPYLYVVVITIMYSGFILDEKGALFTTVASFTLLLLMAFLIKSSVLPIVSMELVDLYALSWVSFFSRLFVYLFFFSIAGLMATGMARAVEKVNRELLERELMTQELKAHFYAIFSSLSIGFVITRNKKIMYANDFARRTCGDLDRLVDKMLGEPYTYLAWYETAWDKRVISYSVQQYVDRQEVVVFSDVTELRLREEENRRREKMAALGQLTASIAHEIKNPLASLMGASEVIFSSMQTADEDSRRLMDIILREGDRVKRLLDNLFTSTEERRLTLSDVSLKALLSDVTGIFALSYPDVEIAAELEEVTVEGDADRLREVCWNLLLNSVEAMKKRGRITLRLEREEHFALITLTDQGGGIPPEYVDKIFDPFFSTKKRGTGLGLAVVFSVVRMHHGDITVRNVEGGAEFRLRIPETQETPSGKKTSIDR